MPYKFTTRNYLANNQDQIILPAGNYSYIGLSWEFDNKAAQTLSLANLGFLRLYNPAGGKVWDFSIERLHALLRRKQPGILYHNSTAGAATNDSFLPIPAGWNGDNNIFRLGTGYVLEYQHGDLSAVLDSATLTLLLGRGLGIQKYMPLYNDYNIRALSAETQPEDFPRKNLAYVTLNPTANISVIKFMKDDNYLYDVTDEQVDQVVNSEGYGFAQNLNSLSYLPGTDNASPWVIDLYREKNLTEIVGSNYKYGAVSSDTTITGMTVEFEMNQAAVDSTSQVMASVKDKNAVTPSEQTVV